jgi:hypothetical protein
VGVWAEQVVPLVAVRALPSADVSRYDAKGEPRACGHLLEEAHVPVGAA